MVIVVLVQEELMEMVVEMLATVIVELVELEDSTLMDLMVVVKVTSMVTDT